MNWIIDGTSALAIALVAAVISLLIVIRSYHRRRLSKEITPAEEKKEPIIST